MYIDRKKFVLLFQKHSITKTYYAIRKKTRIHVALKTNNNAIRHQNFMIVFLYCKLCGY